MEQLVATYTDLTAESSAQSDALNHILISVQRNELSLHSCVQLLGTSLTNEDEKIRQRGTLLLSELVKRLPDLKLQPTEVEFLAEFYTSRLADFACIAEVLTGLNALCANHTLSNERAITCTQSIFSELFVQSLPQPVRHATFTILTSLLDKHFEALQTLGGDLVFGFIQCMDGEKDPRNLVLVFRLIPKLIKGIPEWTRFAEDLYEVTSCYFPIMFTPPPNDPHGITKDDLVLGLRACLVADTQLAEYVVPFLLEKLESSSTPVKLECLATLETALSTFDGDSVSRFNRDVWQAVRNEVVHNGEEQVKNTSLAAISALVKNASTATGAPVFDRSKPATDDQHPLHSLLQLITQHCVHVLKDMASQMAPSCVRILHAAVRACYPSASQVLSATIPQLMENMKSKLPSNRAATMTAIAALLSGSHIAAKHLPSPASPHPAAEYAQDIYEQVSSHVAEKMTAPAAIACLGSLVAPVCIVDNDTLTQIVGHLTTALIEAQTSDIAKSATSALVAIASVSSEEVLENAVQLLVNSFSNTDHTLEQRLSAVDGSAALAKASLPIAVKVFPALASFVAATLTTSPAALTNASAEALATLVYRYSPLREGEKEGGETSEGNDKGDVSFVQATAWPALVKVMTALSALSRDVVLGIIDGLKSLTRAVHYTVGALDDATQLSVVVEQTSFAGDSDLHANPGSIVHAGILTGLQSEQTIGAAYTQQVAAAFLTSLAGESDAALRSLALQALASVANKASEDLVVSSLTAPLVSKLTSIGDDTVQIESDLEVAGYILKGLVVRARLRKPMQAVRDAIDTVLAGSAKYTNAAARAFAIPATDYDLLAGRHANMNSRPLWLQRYFVTELDRLRAGIESTDSETVKRAYTSAVAALAAAVPAEIVEPEQSVLLPLMVVSIQTGEDSTTLAAVIAFVEKIALGQPKVVQKYIDAIIPRLLVLARPPFKLECRRQALSSLRALTTQPYNVVFPLQAKVIADTFACLDDPKRLVRKQAVEARNAWIVLK